MAWLPSSNRLATAANHRLPCAASGLLRQARSDVSVSHITRPFPVRRALSRLDTGSARSTIHDVDAGGVGMHAVGEQQYRVRRDAVEEERIRAARRIFGASSG
jgi:hypothetical protein